jgi:hypothetical protein
MKALQGPRLIAVDGACSEPDLRSDLVRHSGALSVSPQQATRQAGRQIRLPLLIMVKSLWDYRSFVWGGIRRDLQLRYFGSVLGIAWLVIQPAGLIAVNFLIFTAVFPNRTLGNIGNYGAFLCAGLIPWLMFSEIIQRGHTCFLENAALIRPAAFRAFCCRS